MTKELNKDKKPQTEQQPCTDRKNRKSSRQLDALQAELDKVRSEKTELFAKLQRLGADYENYQKRTAKQVADSIAYEKEAIIKSLLPVLDNLDHTLAAARKTQNLDDLLKGLDIIYDQILAVLKSHGVERITSVGKKFDPALHEAMMQRAEPDTDDGIVLEEFQTGYKLNGRLLRPSRVVVNNKTQSQSSDSDNASPTNTNKEREDKTRPAETNNADL